MLLGRDILKPPAVFTATQAHHMSFPLKDDCGQWVEESESDSQLSDPKAEYLFNRALKSEFLVSLKKQGS